MKKSNLLFVLSAFALVGGMTGCSPTKPSTSTSTSTSTVAAKHAVVVPTTVAGAYVTASRSEAVAGDDVDVTVALTDPTNYELKSVKVGSQVLEGKVDANNKHVFHYSFKMGDADANVEVVTAEVVAPTKDHSITFEGKDLVFALSLPHDADVGDHVSFKLAAQSGYEISSVKVVKVSAAAPAAEEGEGEGEGTEEGGEEEPKEELVDLAGNAVLGFSFEMPDADVVIKAEALGAYFKVNADGETTVFTSKGNSKKLTVQDFVQNYRDSEGKDVYFSAPFFRAGSEVKVIAKRTAYTQNVKYFANGKEIETAEDDTYLMYKFTMPASNTDISIEAEDKTVEIEAVNSDHVTITSIYRKVKIDDVLTEVPVTTAYPGDIVYVDFHSSDSEKYRIEKPTSTMLKYDSFSGLTTSEMGENVTTFYVEGTPTDSDATYWFTVPTIYYSMGNFKVKAKEKELLYAGKSFVGTYYGWEFYSQYKSSASMTLNSDGSVKIGYTSRTITSVNKDDTEITLSKNEKLYVNGDTIWSLYETDGDISDIYFVTKAEKSSDVTCKNYGNSTKTRVIQLFNKNTLSGTVLIDKASKTLTYGVEVEILNDAASIESSGAKFVVKKDGVVLYSVGVGDEYGTYKNGESTLVLDGVGKATLDGVAGTYVMEGGKAKVTIGETTTVYTLDKSAWTFAESTDAPVEVPFYVGTYKGKIANDDLSKKFDTTIIINQDGTGSYIHDGKTRKFTFVVKDVTIDNGKATIKAVDDGQRNLSITAKESDGSLDFTYNNSGTYFSSLTITKQA